MSYTTSTLQTLVAFQVLLILNVLTIPPTTLTDALPITSKPIESTAENLAWQAWLMLPPEQKNLEKSRKVTPKSIFTLPFRDCPPGHQLLDSRCIPTVNIDQKEVLTQQLLGFLNGAVGDNNYEFDYDDEDLVVYEPPQKLSGDSGSGAASNYDDASQLPSLDEPLKFNIFQQKFPTDYDAEKVDNSMLNEDASKSSAESFNRTSMAWNGTQFMDAVKGFLERHNMTSTSGIEAQQQQQSVNTTQNATTSTTLADLETAPNLFDEVATSSIAATVNTDRSTFSISDIDAIVLSASSVAPAASNLEPYYKKATQQHKFSLFKDDSAVQVVTTMLSDSTRNYVEAASTQQLLKDDALLPLNKMMQASTATASVTAIPMTTYAMNEQPVSALLSAALTEEEVTDMTAMMSDEADIEATTTLSTVMQNAMFEEQTKNERTRSAEHDDDDDETKSLSAEQFDIAEEQYMLQQKADDFSSTLLPNDNEESTTNFQVDETTIIEAYDPTIIELQELQPQQTAEQQKVRAKEQKGVNHVVRKKSKVEPVRLIAAADAMKTTTAAATITTSSSLSASMSSPSSSSLSSSTSTTPLPTIDAATHDDRFYYQHLRADASQTMMLANNEQRSNSTNTTTTILPTSEIDIAQELRMINALVKGKLQNHAATAINKKTAASSLTAAAEATEATESTNAAAATTTTTTTATSAAGIVAPSSNEKEQTEDVNADSETLNKTVNITTTTVANTATTAEPVASLWSKIMPILGFGATIAETTTTTTTATNNIATATRPTVAASATLAKVEVENFNSDDSSTINSKSSSSINSNRSNRNSKIIRINNSVDESTITTTTLPTITTTTATALTTTVETETSSANSVEPFWWLPIGWRLDRNTNEGDANAEQPLLLRFWSAFPGNQVKVKQ